MTAPSETVAEWPRLADFPHGAVQKRLAFVNRSMVRATHKSGVVPWVRQFSPQLPPQRCSQAAFLWARKPGRWAHCHARLRSSQPGLPQRPQPKNVLSMWSATAPAGQARSSVPSGPTGAASAGSSLVPRAAMERPKRWSRHCCEIVNAQTRLQRRPMVRQRPRVRLAADLAAQCCQLSSASGRLVSEPGWREAAKADRAAHWVTERNPKLSKR
jgi:hypothetical protein